MNGQIFICYRREDSRGSTGRLYDRLLTHFPADRIFIDVDTIAPGDDFVETVEQAVGNCDVVIVVIGADWTDFPDKRGQRMLENPMDFVRAEVRAALERKIRIIPVLVDDAVMPRSEQLPDDIKLLARRNAIEISHTRFNTDFERLVKALKSTFNILNREGNMKGEQEKPETKHEIINKSESPLAKEESEINQGKEESEINKGKEESEINKGKEPLFKQKKKVVVRGVMIFIAVIFSVAIWKIFFDNENSKIKNQGSVATPDSVAASNGQAEKIKIPQGSDSAHKSETRATGTGTSETERTRQKVFGIVRSPRTAIQGAHVQFYTLKNDLLDSSISGLNGKFESETKITTGETIKIRILHRDFATFEKKFTVNKTGDAGEFLLETKKLAISGRVKDSITGIPLAGAEVYFYSQKRVVQSNSTDSRGYFNFEADFQYAKQITIKASKQGYYGKEQSVILRSEGNRTLGDFLLPALADRGLRALIRVNDKKTGKPLPGANVRYRDPIKSTFKDARVSSSGELELTLYQRPGTTLETQISKPGYRTVKKTDVLSGDRQKNVFVYELDKDVF